MMRVGVGRVFLTWKLWYMSRGLFAMPTIAKMMENARALGMAGHICPWMKGRREMMLAKGVPHIRMAMINRLSKGFCTGASACSASAYGRRGEESAIAIVLVLVKDVGSSFLCCIVVGRSIETKFKVLFHPSMLHADRRRMTD